MPDQGAERMLIGFLLAIGAVAVAFSTHRGMLVDLGMVIAVAAGRKLRRPHRTSG